MFNQFGQYIPDYPQYSQYPQKNGNSGVFQQRCEIVHVNGKNGADAFQMPQNSSILLLDDTAPIVWLKVTDGAGYPTLTPYKIVPYQIEAPVDLKSLEERISKIEGMLNNESNSDTAAKRTAKSSG